MKLTKNRLKEIILEELMKMQEEDFAEGFNPDELEKPPEEQDHTPAEKNKKLAQQALNKHREERDENPFDILKGKR
tara:strand:+ start:832 stop:1059 length:228 start_codon:yes stop_codon:yes gene_type:complete